MTLFLSAVTIQELEIGVLRAERRDPEQGTVLRAWLNHSVLPAFADRVLPIDADVARRAAQLHVPDPAPIMDSFLAATAHVHGLTVATRNTADFEATGVDVVNPWAAARC